MSALLLLVRRSSDAPQAVRARLLDPVRHTAVVPFTVVSGRMGEPGDTFVARTRLGPVVLDDPMRVRSATHASDGSGTVVITKGGPWVTGTIVIGVSACGSGTVVTWRQDIALRGLPRALDPVVAVVARLAYGRCLRALLG